jgi:ABC-type dipeptide/oligopeptide/nickel transport system permease subunit
MKTFFDNPARIRFVVFFALCIILCIFSLIAPMLVPNDPGKADLANALMPPSQDYPFGTDQLGRCLYSRVMTGAATSIFSAFILVGVIFTIGTFIGVLSGYYGGKIDTFFMRIVDVLLAFPGMVLAIAVAGMLGSGIVNAVIAIALISWTKYARLSRSLVLSIKEENFIHAARLGGASSLKIVARHVIPNSIGPLVVAASLDIGAVPPAPEWGLMLNEGRSMLQNAPWLLIYPGSAMFMTVAIFNLFGDSVRDILDPKFQKSIIKTTGGIKNA